MDAIVAAIASLAGVVIGGGLTSWLQHRAETRKIFLDAITAIAQFSAAQNWPTRSSTEGTEAPELSAELSRRMHSEFVASLSDARRTLATASALCPELRSYLPRWPQAMMSPEDRTELEEILARELRRAVFSPLRRTAKQARATGTT